MYFDGIAELVNILKDRKQYTRAEMTCRKMFDQIQSQSSIERGPSEIKCQLQLVEISVDQV